MNQKPTPQLKILFINANDYRAFTGADLYTHKLINIINQNYEAVITEYSYDMCIYKHFITSPTYSNVNVIYPSPIRNYRDEHTWLKWGFINFINAKWRCKYQIRKLAPDYDLIISGAMVIYTDKKIMSLPHFILIQHLSYNFVQMKHYKFWQPLAFILTRLYGVRDCFKWAKNLMLYTEYDKLRILEDSKSSLDRNFFFAALSKFTESEIDANWIKKQSIIKNGNFIHDLIYVGRVCKQQKRSHYLDNIAQQLSLNIGCVGGGTYLKKIQKNAAINCYGVLPSNKIADMYIMSRCSILLSDYEGMSGSITEAIAMGTPIITTVNNESTKYLQSKLGDAVQIINPKLKNQKLANEIKRCYEIITKDKTKYAKLCEDCKNFARNQLSMEKFTNSWVYAINCIRKH